MIIDNGTRKRLLIDRVFEGEAVVMGNRVAFVPNRSGMSPKAALAGIMDGQAVFFADMREEEHGAGLWSARWRRNP